MQKSLPRLAFISDVPVERSLAGPLLMYRLLSDYPADKLFIVQTNQFQYHDPSLCLPDVQYRQFEYQMPGIRMRRLFPYWRLHFERTIGNRLLNNINTLIQDFKPEVIASVSHGHLWLAASEYARQNQLPFHLICHDDYVSMMIGNGLRFWMRAIRPFHEMTFRKCYQKATERYCVSPGMVEDYKQKYSADARVLYPSRGEDSPTPMLRVGQFTEKKPILAYAGSVHPYGSLLLFVEAAKRLAAIGGKMIYYGKTPAKYFAEYGLNENHVEVCGFMTPKQVAEDASKKACGLLLLSSFLKREETDVKTLFPSKLVDYTAMGLPIIVWAPDVSSAARWAKENPGASVLLNQLEGQGFESEVQKLFTDNNHASSLATQAIKVGQAQFNAKSAFDVFCNGLTGKL